MRNVYAFCVKLSCVKCFFFSHAKVCLKFYCRCVLSPVFAKILSVQRFGFLFGYEELRIGL